MLHHIINSLKIFPFQPDALLVETMRPIANLARDEGMSSSAISPILTEYGSCILVDEGRATFDLYYYDCMISSSLLAWSEFGCAIGWKIFEPTFSVYLPGSSSRPRIMRPFPSRWLATVFLPVKDPLTPWIVGLEQSLAVAILDANNQNF